jgi:threonyl-tRNA synthetase
VILASASPRRKALLAQVCLPPFPSSLNLALTTKQIGLPDLEIIPSTEPEDLDKKQLSAEEYVLATARRKCLAVYQAALSSDDNTTTQQDQKEQEDPAVVIAADTIISTKSGQILEKPRSEAEHVRMLKHLRDTREHRVLTAVCVLAPKADASHPGYELASHVEETRVTFAEERDGLPDDVIESYVRTREGVDKAGGYAIQGIGGMLLVERVAGAVDNVIGLPVRKCLQLCEKVVFRQGMEEEEVGSDAD